MTILVTGATGFVGSAVARQLLAAGASVRVLARPQGDRRNLDGLEVEIAEGDLNDAASVTRAVAGCSALYHVAADYRIWVPNPPAIYRTNVDATVGLLRAAADAGIGRMVYTSSVATLGRTQDGSPADEDTPVTLDDMVGHYKRSKYLAEAAVQRLVREDGLPVVIVNPSTPVGPRDIKPTPTGRMIEDAAAGRMPAYVDTGLNIVHVDDVAAGHLQAFEKGRIGERYVLGGENLTLRDIFAAVAEITDRPPPRLRLPIAAVVPVAVVAEAFARLTGGEPLVTLDSLRMARKKMYFSAAKAERALGYRPRPAAAAFHDAVDWLRRNGRLAG